ncbi:MAG: L-ascorbate metabolism protein UlaG (beta-lactamase superfamily) [Limisphaerales bacterium]|jgi:L-ascorbate metabolism protein UlaG (beta-lactamase superfamily)
MKVTFYGHSSFLITLDEEEGNEKPINLLIDPFISPNPNAADIDIDQIPADYILVSHGHGDHIADVASIARRTGATLISTFEIVNWFAEKEKINNGHPMNHGGAFDFDFGSVKLTNAVHSSTLPDGSPGGHPAGFIIRTNSGNDSSDGSNDKSRVIYYAGDTALTMDMKLIGLYDKPDVALLPIGDNFTMGPRDAAIASEFIQCKQIIGMHYDTFGYIQIDHDAAKKEFEDRGASLTLLEIGETMKIN